MIVNRLPIEHNSYRVVYIFDTRSGGSYPDETGETSPVLRYLSEDRLDLFPETREVGVGCLPDDPMSTPK